MSISASTAEAARRVVEELPEGVRVGPPRTHGGLTVFPLSSSRPVQPLRYLTLDQAIAAGTFHVAEVSEGGRVPDLKVVNDGDAHVLLPVSRTRGHVNFDHRSITASFVANRSNTRGMTRSSRRAGRAPRRSRINMTSGTGH